MDKNLQAYDEKQRDLFRRRQELEATMTTRQMGARIKREFGISPGQITLYQVNENDINRVAWSACIDGTGWLQVQQNYTSEWDSKRDAERSARIEVYIELLLGGQELVDAMRRER